MITITKELARLFVVNAICGGAMWICMSLVRENYKKAYALVLMAITGITLTFAVSFGTLFALGIALAAYLLFLLLSNPEPALPWSLPAFWLAAHGYHLVTTDQMAIDGKIVAFGAAAILVIICPFILSATRQDGENATVNRNKALLWSSLVLGLAGCFITIVIQ